MGFELKKYRRRSNKVINNAIGVLITEYNPFYAAVAIEAIQHVAEKNGLTVLVCTSQEQSGRRNAQPRNTARPRGRADRGAHLSRQPNTTRGICRSSTITRCRSFCWTAT